MSLQSPLRQITPEVMEIDKLFACSKAIEQLEDFENSQSEKKDSSAQLQMAAKSLTPLPAASCGEKFGPTPETSPEAELPNCKNVETCQEKEKKKVKNAAKQKLKRSRNRTQKSATNLRGFATHSKVEVKENTGCNHEQALEKEILKLITEVNAKVETPQVPPRPKKRKAEFPVKEGEREEECFDFEKKPEEAFFIDNWMNFEDDDTTNRELVSKSTKKRFSETKEDAIYELWWSDPQLAIKKNAAGKEKVAEPRTEAPNEPSLPKLKQEIVQKTVLEGKFELDSGSKQELTEGTLRLWEDHTDDELGQETLDELILEEKAHCKRESEEAANYYALREQFEGARTVEKVFLEDEHEHDVVLPQWEVVEDTFFERLAQLNEDSEQEILDGIVLETNSREEVYSYLPFEQVKSAYGIPMENLGWTIRKNVHFKSDCAVLEVPSSKNSTFRKIKLAIRRAYSKFKASKTENTAGSPHIERKRKRDRIHDHLHKWCSVFTLLKPASN